MDEKIFSIKEINYYIKNLLEGDSLLSNFWVKGEISNFTHHSSGHMYFTLKDESGSIRSVMFRSRAGRLKFKPVAGKKVIALGYISLYEKSGQYQFYVQEMHEKGLGSLQEKYEKLKKQLAEEGLFSEESKKDLPFFPKKIGVVTSPSGAAVRDIITVTKRRMPQTKIVISPAVVQGDESKYSIVDALEKLYSTDVELIIVGRGGGALEELWAFNEEIVVRKIKESPVPVISAVGHETDFTLSDFAADKRAATPSMAAEIAVPNIEDLSNSLENLTTRLSKNLLHKLNIERNRLELLSSKKILRNPEKIWEIKNLKFEAIKDRFMEKRRQQLENKEKRFMELANKLEILSPLKTLNRGYSIAYDEKDNLITDSMAVETGSKVRVRLKRGEIFCRVVERVEKNG